MKMILKPKLTVYWVSLLSLYPIMIYTNIFQVIQLFISILRTLLFAYKEFIKCLFNAFYGKKQECIKTICFPQ